MTLFGKLGITSEKELKRVDSGEGKIYERTIELAEDVIVIENIGSIVLIDDKRNHTITIIAAVIGFFGLSVFGFNWSFGLEILAAGIALGAWNFMRQMETYLSIGTCDGKSMILVSKNRDFLKEVSNFLRNKIDTKSKSSATINITNSTLEGTIAVGPSSSAYTQN